MHKERERRLTDQYHFVQRLRNKDTRFSSDLSYLFAAAAYLEKKQLQRNINVSFQRGKKTVSATGQHSYSLEDGFSVFDKISNTPAYWKTAKYEMLAKLENLGPFQFFFTLSSADSRWDDNFSSILREMDITIEYKFDENGNEETNVKLEDGTKIELQEYLETHVDQSRHELIRTNVVNASRIYNHRVKAFIKEIVMDKNNPMAVEYFSTKVEFQGREAGHNHGTLWVNLKKMEYYLEVEKGRWMDLEKLLVDFPDDPYDSLELINDIKDLLLEIAENKSKEEKDREDIVISERMKDIFKIILQLENNEQVTSNSILLSFPLFGISSAFQKFQSLESLCEHEERAIINFADKFTTCTLNKAKIESMTEDEKLKKKSAELLDIVYSVNIHSHTQTCKKYLTICRFNFAKFPVWKTLISKPFTLISPELRERYSSILKKVKAIIEDKEIIEKIKSEYPDMKNEDRDEYERNREERVKKVLNLAGLKTQEEYDHYISALESSTSGYSIILQRDINEIYVNSYNPEWARAWNGNHDLQICLDYFAVITYITEYYTKDDTGTMKILIEALKSSNCEDLKDKMKLLMNTYIAARQMGETEALYKIFPDFHLKDSNVTTVNVPVNRKENRSKFSLKVTEENSHNLQEKIKILGREGFYVEKYDTVSKFERKEDGNDELSFSQFSKMYGPSWKYKESTDNDKQDETDDEDIEGGEVKNINHEHPSYDTKFNFTMRCRNDPSDPDHKLCHLLPGIKLKQYIKLKNPFPGEPPYMKKRTHPAVLRFHKFKQDKNPSDYFFSQALLYKPFSDEQELERNIQDLSSSELDNHNSPIRCVKQQVMEYLDDVSEARYFSEKLQRHEEVGQELDPQGEQEVDDCEFEGLIEHPDFPDLDLEMLEAELRNNVKEKTFKAMEIDHIDVLLEKTRNLDYYQRKVVEVGIRYARNIIKSMKSRNPLPTAPNFMIHGGAGAGKSSVINIVKQWVHLILQTSGDSPDCPYIFVTAPTGTAAANVSGQTMHSAFGFTFGNEHFAWRQETRSDAFTSEKLAICHNR